MSMDWKGLQDNRPRSGREQQGGSNSPSKGGSWKGKQDNRPENSVSNQQSVTIKQPGPDKTSVGR